MYVPVLSEGDVRRKSGCRPISNLQVVDLGLFPIQLHNDISLCAAMWVATDHTMP